MADATILSFGQLISAGSTAISDNSATALDIESTDGKDYIKVSTVDGSEALILCEDAGKVGIGAAPDLCVANGLHIKIADAGAITGSLSGSGQSLVIENNGHVGMSLISSNSTDGAIHFGDPDAATRGSVKYKHGTNIMEFGTDGTTRLTIDSTGIISSPATDSAWALLPSGTSGANDGSRRPNMLPDKRDTDTGMWVNGGNVLTLTTSGYDRVVVDADGKVGIGAAPECIAGGLHIQTEDTSTGTGGSTNPNTAALLIEGTAPKAVFACGSGVNDVSQLQFLHSDGDDTGTEVGRIMAGKSGGALLMRFDFGTNAHMEYTGKGWNIGQQAAPDGSALFQITSTSKGFLLPRMTTTQRDAIGSPADGLVIYDTVTDKINVRADGAWEVVTSS